ncbi:hypothetical protein ACIRRA_03375 [Nocardia sp. NPDC101769]|uniref:hypothetical protein n=1 Tax=Nocardia sp. NPDC101769 TaxID=3364333 RepID=UPI0037FE6BC8
MVTESHDADPAWIVATVGPLGQSDACNVIACTLGTDPDGYEWRLSGTWPRLATMPSRLPILRPGTMSASPPIRPSPRAH